MNQKYSSSCLCPLFPPHLLFWTLRKGMYDETQIFVNTVSCFFKQLYVNWHYFWSWYLAQYFQKAEIIIRLWTACKHIRDVCENSVRSSYVVYVDSCCLPSAYCFNCCSPVLTVDTLKSYGLSILVWGWLITLQLWPCYLLSHGANWLFQPLHILSVPLVAIFCIWQSRSSGDFSGWACQSALHHQWRR